MIPIQSNFLSLPDPSSVKGGLLQWRELMIPSALGALLLNVMTQGLCVRGVNRLTAVSPPPLLCAEPGLLLLAVVVADEEGRG